MGRVSVICSASDATQALMSIRRQLRRASSRRGEAEHRRAANGQRPSCRHTVVALSKHGATPSLGADGCRLNETKANVRDPAVLLTIPPPSRCLAPHTHGGSVHVQHASVKPARVHTADQHDISIALGAPNPSARQGRAPRRPPRHAAQVPAQGRAGWSVAGSVACVGSVGPKQLALSSSTRGRGRHSNTAQARAQRHPLHNPRPGACPHKHLNEGTATATGRAARAGGPATRRQAPRASCRAPGPAPAAVSQNTRSGSVHGAAHGMLTALNEGLAHECEPAQDDTAVCHGDLTRATRQTNVTFQTHKKR